MTDLKSTCLDIFENFKQNGNKWEEVHEEGAQLLSRWAKKAVVEETVFSLKLVLEKFRKLLHSMHHDKHRLLTVLSSLPTESAELAVDHGADRKYPSIVDILDFMSIYLEMYENECLLQETVIASVNDTEPTQQRVDSLVALWKSQSYINSRKIEYIEDRMSLLY